MANSLIEGEKMIYKKSIETIYIFELGGEHYA